MSDVRTIIGRAACCGILRHVADKTTQYAARHLIRCERSFSRGRETVQRYTIQNMKLVCAEKLSVGQNHK